MDEQENMVPEEETTDSEDSVKDLDVSQEEGEDVKGGASRFNG